MRISSLGHCKLGCFVKMLDMNYANTTDIQRKNGVNVLAYFGISLTLGY